MNTHDGMPTPTSTPTPAHCIALQCTPQASDTFFVGNNTDQEQTVHVLEILLCALAGHQAFNVVKCGTNSAANRQTRHNGCELG